MNPSSTSTSAVAPVLTDYRQRSSNLRSKILQNEEQRMQLEQRLRAMSAKTSQTHQRRQIQHIQTYFTRLNQESQRAEERNLNLLSGLTEAQQHLDQLHDDAEHLTRLKADYLAYLESHYPKWQRPTSSGSSINTPSTNEYDRLAQQIQQRDHLQSDGNLRQIPMVRRSYDADSPMLFKRYEDQLNVGFDRTNSPPIPVVNSEIKDEHLDERSQSESSDPANVFSRGKRTGSLRMELNRQGLYFLFDYLEKEFKETIEKKKLYRDNQPTIPQKRAILDIANSQQHQAVKDQDVMTVAMVVLDQLPSTIRRTTLNKCLLTEEILTSNIQDLDQRSIAQMIPEQDRALWLRLTEHFAQLLKLHIMNSHTLAEKFAVSLLPVNVLYLHEKAKSLLKHIMEKHAGTQSSSSDDDVSVERKLTRPYTMPTANSSSTSSWLKKLEEDHELDDDDDPSTASSWKMRRDNQAASFPVKARTSTSNKEDSDIDFFN